MNLLVSLAMGNDGSLERITNQIINKFRIADQIPFPKPTRLTAQPEKPFQTATAHPSRCLEFRPRDKIECSANADHHRDIQSITMQVHQVVLFWRTQPHPQDIRVSRIDPRDRILAL